MVSRTLCVALLNVVVGSILGCPPRPVAMVEPVPRRDPRGPQVERVRVGRAIIVLGMTYQQVLDEIEISQRQHDELVHITGRRLGTISPEEARRSGVDVGDTGWNFISGPLPGVEDIDELWLRCPALNSRHLGDGSGFMLHLVFRDGLLAELRRGPWLGC